MKRLWICLLAFALLTGCGDSGDIAVTTVYETDDPPRTALTTEWETYDPSVETVWCILSYEGEGESLEYGAPYWLDVREADGSWTQVPLAENAGWDAMLYTLPSGEKQAFPCILSLFDYDFSGGSTFRVIKEIGEYTAAAEFTLTKGRSSPQRRLTASAPWRPGGALRRRCRGVYRGGNGECGCGGDIFGEGLPGHPLPAADPSELL